MHRFFIPAAAVIVLFGFAAAAPLRAAGTVTFTSDGAGTFPATMRLDPAARRLTVDLSALPADARIFRAELVLKPLTNHLQQRPLEPTRVYAEDQPDRPLPFVPPRNVSLDALDAVVAAVQQRRPLVLRVEQTCAGVERLEISWDRGQPRRAPIPAVSGVQATHRAGQTLLVFREPALTPFPSFASGADVRAFAKRLRDEHPGVTFRIWRSAQRITPQTIHQARLVGECAWLTCWNSSYHQDDTDKQPPLRYRVRDGGEEVPWGTGLYAHNPDQPGRAFYAVTVAVAGEENLDQLNAADTTGEPVEETVGPGAPVLQWRETPAEWMYRRAAEGSHLVRLIYTRWEAWPHAPAPSKPIDYLVALPVDPPPGKAVSEPHYRAWRVEPAPVGLHLHCWGGSLNGGYGWWYNAHRGAVLIASNQVPYDWWTGHHEALGGCRTWGDGRVQPFTMTRLFGFLDWAANQWKEAPESVRRDWPQLDATRVFTAGSSMGGSGAPMYAIRFGDRVAWGLGWVGVHIPAESPQFQNSYAAMYGPRDPRIAMPDGTSPWDYFSDVWWLEQHPQQDTGLVIASNGKNDGGIGWPQAVRFARALQETRRPHLFNWGLAGHGTRTLIGQNLDLDVRTDQSLPAFTRGSLDDDIGTARRQSAEELAAARRRQEAEVRAGRAREVVVDPYDGDPTGAYNAHLRWDTGTIVDTPTCWEVTVVLADTAPRDECRVDLTPRRLQQFRTPAGRPFVYTVTSLPAGRQLARGEAVADRWHLLTLPQIPLVKGPTRVRIEPRPD